MTRNEQELRQQVTFLNQALRSSERKRKVAEAQLAKIQDADFVERVTAKVREQRSAQQRERHASVSTSIMAESET